MSGLLIDLAKEVAVGLLTDVARTVMQELLEAPNSSSTTIERDNEDLDNEPKKKETAAAGGVELKPKDDEDLDDELKKKETAGAGGVELKPKDDEDLDDEPKKKETAAAGGVELKPKDDEDLDDEPKKKETAAAGGVGLKAKDIAMRAGMAAGVRLLQWGATRLIFGSSSSSSEPVLMKAPGKPSIRINREDFEANPADYFRRLRAEKKFAKQLFNGFSTTTK